jgi:hypothetical protein
LIATDLGRCTDHGPLVYRHLEPRQGRQRPLVKLGRVAEPQLPKRQLLC